LTKGLVEDLREGDCLNFAIENQMAFLYPQFLFFHNNFVNFQWSTGFLEYFFIFVLGRFDQEFSCLPTSIFSPHFLWILKNFLEMKLKIKFLFDNLLETGDILCSILLRPYPIAPYFSKP